ncbi:PREDICTED: carcinine transporter-like [Rhagoletis zephyria]|uniref:carcinine transporter-like n=1 Tax=Rhagoletis zephyria TaxID=28612 RepID=UPI00081199A7|nr:PREDICTED: carcinine transporter-like [Rhagoletis zephyria]
MANSNEIITDTCTNTFSRNETEKTDESLDFDDLLPIIGEFGKYQKLLVFGICLPACIPCGFCAFNQIFMANVPDDYWCNVPELLQISVEKRKLLAIPKNVLAGFRPFFRIL